MWVRCSADQMAVLTATCWVALMAVHSVEPLDGRMALCWAALSVDLTVEYLASPRVGLWVDWMVVLRAVY